MLGRLFAPVFLGCVKRSMSSALLGRYGSRDERDTDEKREKTTREHDHGSGKLQMQNGDTSTLSARTLTPWEMLTLVPLVDVASALTSHTVLTQRELDEATSMPGDAHLL
jgi:hypothetical protein